MSASIAPTWSGPWVVVGVGTGDTVGDDAAAVAVATDGLDVAPEPDPPQAVAITPARTTPAMRRARTVAVIGPRPQGAAGGWVGSLPGRSGTRRRGPCTPATP